MSNPMYCHELVLMSLPLPPLPVVIRRLLTGVKVKLLTISSSLTMGVFGTLKEVIQVRCEQISR